MFPNQGCDTCQETSWVLNYIRRNVWVPCMQIVCPTILRDMRVEFSSKRKLSPLEVHSKKIPELPYNLSGSCQLLVRSHVIPGVAKNGADGVNGSAGLLRTGGPHQRTLPLRPDDLTGGILQRFVWQ